MATAYQDAKARKIKQKYEVIKKAQRDADFVLGEGYRENLIRALNALNSSHELEEKKQWAIDYMKREGHFIKGIDKFDDFDYRTIGTLAYIHENMFALSEHDLVQLDHRINDLKKRITVEREHQPTNVPTLSVQEKIKQKAGLIGEEIDYYIDSVFSGSKDTFDINGFIAKHSVNPAIGKHLIDQILPIIGDINADDAEEIHTVGKRQLNFIKKQLEDIINGLLKDASAKKAMGKPRTPRKKRQKPPSELVKSLKFLKEFPELSIKSVSPTEIIGADVLVCYDTSKRKATMFISGSVNGLTVRGSSIVGFDVDQSMMKAIRKPEVLQTWGPMTKRPLKKAFDEIKSVSRVPTGRINEHTLIFKVIK